MRYSSLKEAILNAKTTGIREIIEAVCKYTKISETDVELVMMPLIKLWEKGDEAGKPVIGIWRNIATSQFESYIVMKIAERENGIPAYFIYAADIFNGSNKEKSVFEKNKLFYQQGINMATIHLCYDVRTMESKPLCRIVTQNGLTLVEHHMRMRKKLGFPNENIIDLGNIFRKLLNLSPDKINFSHKDGRVKKEWYYLLWMIIASKLVILEDFEVCKGEMKDLVNVSYERSVGYGLNPQFVLLKASKPVDWYMTEADPKGVPDEIKRIIDEIK